MTQLRVLSYNVRGLRDDVPVLAEIVRRCRPDVLVVQEAPAVLRWRSKCAALARTCGLVYVAGGRTAGGNLLLCHQRISVHGVSEQRIPQRLRDPIRGVVAATLGEGSLRFGVVGIHLGLSAEGRRREVGEVLATTRSFGDLPVIVAGDLNEHPDGPSWKAFTEAGLRDLGVDGAVATFPAGGPSARIDGIFASGERIVGRGCGVPESAGLADAGDPEDPSDLGADFVQASDHLPVLAVLDIS
ncbi:endonuclease/exonuclease/phosphatase family protein [Actinopolymorpha alba]|uniref:endonuclease/exonuclease/phosphatase family protein n=1 Tax=Actinopolymorpha alba TaxID=533267 RepID=UPI00035E8676|nr:endonuclease/exonuclease/phosphatase family protein [Actinopolymorpha alba]